MGGRVGGVGGEVAQVPGCAQPGQTVGGDDFGWGVVGELKGKAGLAGGGGAGDDEEGRSGFSGRWRWQGSTSYLLSVRKSLKHTGRAMEASALDVSLGSSFGRTV